jgi:glycosyltransferase involved in cell wall biosynthesis
MPQHILLYTDAPETGGVAQYNYTILSGLIDRGYQVTCVQSKNDSPLIQQQQALGIRHEWLSFDPVKEFDRNLTDIQAAAALLKRICPDLIFFSDCCPLSNFAAKQAVLHYGAPYAMVVGFVAPYLAERFSSYLPALSDQFAQAQAVIAVSQENLDLLHEQFRLPPDQGQVIHPGRPESYFAPRNQAERDRLREELNIPADAVVCFTAARLEGIKGFDYQLQAIAQLQQTPIWQNLYWIWAGDGSLRAQLTDIIQQLGASDQVKLLGQRWDVSSWYDAADLFVLPTRLEGMPLAVMEAMAKGLPVVASAVSGIPEELGDTVTQP